MKPIWIIATKELNSFFNSLIAYILLVAYLGVSGFFTWLYGNDILMSGQANLSPFLSIFGIPNIVLFIIIPALTMRLIAEEKKSGTIELLLTKPATDRQVVVGKFLSIVLLLCIAFAFTLPYYFSLASIGNVDHGAILSGYFALILMSSAYASIGLFASSLTSNQIVAFLIALFINVMFHVVFYVLSFFITGKFGEFFYYLSVPVHFESIARGVIDTKDLIYFGSIIVIGLFLSEVSLMKRNIEK